MKFSRWFIFSIIGLFIIISCSLDETTGPEPDPDPEPLNILCINEFLASNDTANEDEFGGFDDWFELFNGTEAAINIGGMYVSDDLTDLTKWQIPDTDSTLTTVEPGEFLLIWADSETEQGVLHVDFKLSSGGEDLVITDVDGVTIIDSYTFGGQTTDVSVGRLPDGTDSWSTFDTPTPGASNQ